MVLDENPVTLKELYESLAIAKQQYTDLAVVIRGDRETRLQQIMQVFDACQDAGIHGLNISVLDTETALLPSQTSSR